MLLGLDSYSFHLAFARHEDFSFDEPIDLFQFIDRVSKLGFQGFQIDPMHLESDKADYVLQLKSLADERGLFVEHGIMSVQPEDILSGIHVCQMLDSSILRTFIGFDRFSPATHVRHELEQAKLDISRTLKALQDADVYLAIENHGDVTSEELVELVLDIGDPHVGICLDVGNSLCVLEDPMQAFDRMLPYALTTHFKDYMLSMTNFGCKIYGTALGCGILPLKEMYQKIVDQGKLGKLILEIPVEAESQIEATLAKEQQAIEASIEYCRKELNI
jgi:sugar phosphate isomerase/epimerase